MKLNKIHLLTKKLKVLLVETHREKENTLDNILKQLNYDVECISYTGISIYQNVQLTQPDIIVIDIKSPDSILLESLNSISHSIPKPVVMFSDKGEQTTINQFVKSGVNAYLIGAIETSRIKSIIDVAIARFKEYQSLKNELKLAKKKLSSQKVVEKAKLWLMQSRNISESDAYHFIRKTAMDNSQKVEDVANNLLAMESMFSKK